MRGFVGLLFLLAQACGSLPLDPLERAGALAAPREFSITASPSNLQGSAGSSLSTSLLTAITSGTTQTVTLSIAGLPAGVTATFAPASMSAGKSSVLKLVIDPCAASWSGAVTVTATGPSATHSASLQLAVAALSGPVPAFTSPAAGAVLSGTQSSVASALSCAAVASTEIWLDGTLLKSALAAKVTARWESTAWPDGNHTLTARATDSNGLKASLSIPVTIANSAATRDFTISVTPSWRSVTPGGAAATYTISTSELVGQAQPLQLSLSGVPSGVTARLSQSALTAGASATLTVQAAAGAPPVTSALVTIVAAGVYGSHSCQAQLTVKDIVAPTVSISMGSSGNLRGPVAVTVSAADNGPLSTVELDLDGVSVATSAGPFTWPFDTTAVSDGAHQLAAIATDASGNQSRATQAVTVLNDALSHDFSLSFFGQPGVDQGFTGTFQVTTAATVGAPQPIALAVTGFSQPGVSVTVSPATVQAGQPFSLIISAAALAPPGQFPVTITGTGLYRSRTLTIILIIVDPTPPSISIGAPVPGSTLAGVATFTASASDNVPSGVASISFAVDGAAVAATQTAGEPRTATALLDTTSLSDGAHTLSATARDLGGNATSSSLAFSVQNSAATNDFSVSAAPGSVTAGNEQTVSLTVSTAELIGVPEQLTLSATGFGANGPTINPTSVSPVTAGKATTWTVSTLDVAPGTYTGAVLATGRYGQHSAPITVTVVDSLAPDLWFENPVPGDVVAGKQVLWFSATDNSGAVSVTGSLDGAALTLSGSSGDFRCSVDTAFLQDGPHTLSATAQDPSGNSTTRSATFQVKNNPATRDFGASALSSLPLRGGQSTTLAVRTTTLRGAPQPVTFTASASAAWVQLVTPPPATSGDTVAFGLSATAGAPAGPVVVTISVTGLYRTATANVTVNVTDSVPPTVSFLPPPGPLSATVPLAMSATDDTGVISGSFLADGSFLSRGFSLAWDTTSVADGDHLLTASACDAAGNCGTASATVTVTNSAATHDFSLTADAPAFAAVPPNGSTSLALTTVELLGAPERLTFQVSGAPPGMLAFAQPVMAGNPATLSVWPGSVAPGTYPLTISATGVYSTHAASVSVQVLDGTPPALSFSPGSPLAGTAHLSAAATDASGVQGLTLQVDGLHIAAAPGASIAFNLDTTTLADGAHVLTATATDTAGNVATVPATVQVQNSAATRSFTFSGCSQGLTLAAGGSASCTLQTAEVLGAPQSLVLSAALVPAGLSATFDPPSVIAGAASTLTVSALPSATGGTLRASAAGLYSTSLLSIPVAVAGPDVSISPAGGASLSGAVQLSATALAAAGVAVSQVTLLLDGVTKATAAGASISLSWDTTASADGNHTVKVTATDAFGRIGSSTSTFAVLNSPSTRDFDLSVSGLPAGPVSQGQRLTFTVNTSATRGAPQAISLSSSTSYVSFSPSTVTAGQSSTATVLTADLGLGAVSFVVSGRGVYVTKSAAAGYTALDTTPPVLSLQPAGGATVSGIARLVASCSDQNWCPRVELWVDGALAATGTAGVPPRTSWDSRAVPDGPHVLEARGWDPSGNQGSAVATVNVLNAPSSGQLVLDGSFDRPNESIFYWPWIIRAGAPSISAQALSGTGAVLLPAGAAIGQLVQVPSAATSAQLSFFIRGNGLGAQTAAVLDRSGTLLLPVFNGVAPAGWTQVQADLSSFAGQVVELSFSSSGGQLYLDDVSLVVTPDGVGSAAPCTGQGNVIWLDGSPGDWVHPGQQLLGALSASSWVDANGPYDVRVRGAVDYWNVELLKSPFAAGIFEGAVRATSTSWGGGVDVFGNGRGCNTIAGRTQILSASFDAQGNPLELTATFEQSCEAFMPVLRGCVHWQAP